MSSPPRRALTIDDPVAGAAACHVAHPGAEAASRLREIPLNEIHPNPDQPRERFDQAWLNALADSIRERGVLQPIIVQPRSAGGYQLIAGERRWRAAKLADLPSIPALVDDQVDGVVSLELALIENVARPDLTVIEEARTIAVLLDDLHVTTALLARRLGRSRSDLAHTVPLLELPDHAIELIDVGSLSKGHGKALLTEPDHHRRRELAKRATEGGWSVRALEAEIARGARAPSRASQPHPDQLAAVAKLYDLVARATGCEMEARPHRLGYQLILDQNAVDRLAELHQPRGRSRSTTRCHVAQNRPGGPRAPSATVRPVGGYGRGQALSLHAYSGHGRRVAASRGERHSA
jgi:ParB family chromosome partitioning protein